MLFLRNVNGYFTACLNNNYNYHSFSYININIKLYIDNEMEYMQI